MSARRAALLMLCLAAPALRAWSADSVVLGNGLSNTFAFLAPCPSDAICPDSYYLWALRAKQTVLGPPIRGPVKAISEQHTAATARYVRSVRLFVLRPIANEAQRKELGADYFLVAQSPRYPNGEYCLSVNPIEVGLDLEPSQVRVDPTNRYFCFKWQREFSK